MQYSLNQKQFKMNGRMCSLYEIGKNMSDVQLQQVAHALNEKGMDVIRIEFYEYTDNDTMRHLLLTMKDGRKLRYFELEKEMIEQVFMEIVAEAGKI